MTKNKITAEQFYATFLNLLQYYADMESTAEDGVGEIDWEMSVMHFADLLEEYPVNITLEIE